MLEKSVLRLNEIPKLLSAKYGFSDVSVISPLLGGSANLWKVQCDGDWYVLKEFQSRYSASDVWNEPEVANSLARKGLPIPSFVCKSSGGYVWTFRNRVFHLQRFVEGNTIRYNRAPQWLISRCAELLTDIHEAMSDFTLPNHWPQTWYEVNTYKLKSEYSKLLREAERMDQVAREVIVPDLLFRLNTVSDLIQFELRPDMFTYRMTHGDFHIGQFLVSGEEVTAILDFSATGSLPVVWEIIRSFTYASPECADGSIPVHRLVEYVEIYLQKMPLLKSDVENMLPLYYSQVLRSKYGYREYLAGTEEPERMLAFAIWRTKLCRWLSDNLVEASYELTSSLSKYLSN